jgi:hypothetical protein
MLACALALPAAASKRAVAHFRVVSAKGSATLTFHAEAADQSEVSDGKISLAASSKGRAKASLPGKALAPLKGALSERVLTKRRESPTSQYQEQTCANTRKLGGRGGVALRRVGSKVEVRWAFPQAKPSFCRGPSVGASITSAMKRLYPGSRFTGASATIVLSGSKTIRSGTATTIKYRWRATVKLVRT